jgi:hypothetical protein
LPTITPGTANDAYGDDFETSSDKLAEAAAQVPSTIQSSDDIKRAGHASLLQDETNSPYGNMIVVLLGLLHQSPHVVTISGTNTTANNNRATSTPTNVRGYITLINLVLKCYSITRLPDHRRLLVALFGTLRSGDIIVQILSVTALERLLSIDTNRQALAHSGGSGMQDLATLCSTNNSTLQRALARVYTVCCNVPASVGYPKSIINGVIIPSLSLLAASHDPFVHALAGVSFLSMLDNKEAVSVMMTRSLLVNNAPGCGFHTLCYLLSLPPPHAVMTIADAPARRSKSQSQPLTPNGSGTTPNNNHENDGLYIVHTEDSYDPWAIATSPNGHIIPPASAAPSAPSSRKGSRRPSVAAGGGGGDTVTPSMTSGTSVTMIHGSRRNSSALQTDQMTASRSTTPQPQAQAHGHGVGDSVNNNNTISASNGRARELAVRQHWQRRARVALSSLQSMCLTVLRDISGIPVLVGSMARFGGLHLVMDLIIHDTLPLNSDTARVIYHMAAHDEGREALVCNTGLQCVMILVNSNIPSLVLQGVDCLSLIVPLCVDRALTSANSNNSSSGVTAPSTAAVTIPSSTSSAAVVAIEPRLL